ncbi:MAG: restriction endonuclease subunit S, partial [Alphaproteobacteria bacterium]|nr:restriction endonuclease subunit S [Alphaproteobacteria bacterium]
MTIPQGYKWTELGIIPEDWEVKQISDFTTVVTGGTPSTQHTEYWGGDIRWMNSGELNLKFVYDVEGRITEEGLHNSSTHVIPAECVLVGLAGQGKTRGTAAYNLVSLCTNQSIAAFLPTDKHSSLYLYYVIDSKYDYLRLLSSGDGGRGGLNKQILGTINVVLPPIAEQRAIA